MSKRTEIKKRQFDLFGDKTLLEICIDVRHAINGAADAWEPREVAKTRQLLADAVATWEPTSQPCDQEIDDAVLALVKATIRYIELNPESMDS